MVEEMSRPELQEAFRDFCRKLEGLRGKKGESERCTQARHGAAQNLAHISCDNIHIHNMYIYIIYTQTRTGHSYFTMFFFANTLTVP